MLQQSACRSGALRDRCIIDWCSCVSVKVNLGHLYGEKLWSGLRFTCTNPRDLSLTMLSTVKTMRFTDYLVVIPSDTRDNVVLRNLRTT